MINKAVVILGVPGLDTNVIAEHVAYSLGAEYLNCRSDGGHELVPGPVLERECSEVVITGYPRSLSEAKSLKNLAKGLTVISLTAEVDFICKLSRRRLACKTCNYVLYDPQPQSILGVECANCHVPLVQGSSADEARLADQIKAYRSKIVAILNEIRLFAEVYEMDGSKPVSVLISDAVEYARGIKKDSLAERGARMLVEGLGLNLADPNIIGTPTRIVKSLKGLMSGQYSDAHEKIKKDLETVFPTRYKGMVIIEPIKCISLCSHHLLPVQYEVYFGYLVAKKSLGFSKITKVISAIAAKPALQEDFTQEVTDTFNKVLQPLGIMVVVKGIHTCISMRGDRSANVNTTSAVRGVFKTEQAVRDEFLSLSQVSGN